MWGDWVSMRACVEGKEGKKEAAGEARDVPAGMEIERARRGRLDRHGGVVAGSDDTCLFDTVFFHDLDGVTNERASYKEGKSEEE